MKQEILLLLADNKNAGCHKHEHFLMHSNDIDMGMLLPLHP